VNYITFYKSPFVFLRRTLGLSFNISNINHKSIQFVYNSVWELYNLEIALTLPKRCIIQLYNFLYYFGNRTLVRSRNFSKKGCCSVIKNGNFGQKSQFPFDIEFLSKSKILVNKIYLFVHVTGPYRWETHIFLARFSARFSIIKFSTRSAEFDVAMLEVIFNVNSVFTSYI